MTDIRALLARTADKVLADVGWDVERDGLARGPGSVSEAEDAVQECWLRLDRSRPMRSATCGPG